MPGWLLFHLRILFKHRLYTLSSLSGLAIAISSCWFIANFVRNAQQYDAFHQKADHIYRLTMEVITDGSPQHFAATGKPLGHRLKEGFSGIRAYAKMTMQENAIVEVNDELFQEEGIFRVNPGVLDVFTFDLISGNGSTCFSSPNAVLLSRELSEKYFNSVDVVNRPITIGDSPYIIRGVFDNWPENSHLKVEALVYPGLSAFSYQAQDWFNLEHYNYVLVEESISRNELDDKLVQLKRRELKPILAGSGIDVKLNGQPLKNLYFEPGLIDDVPKGNLLYVYGIALAGLIVLLISGVNYINLSLLQSIRRQKEISLKKVLGISGKQLLFQRSMESLLMAGMVLVISGILVGVFDPAYFYYTGFHSSGLSGNWWLLLGAFSFVFLLGMPAAGYAGAFFTFSPTLAKKNRPLVNTFKKVLLGFQFGIASLIIITTLVIHKQIHYIKNKDLGFSKNQVLTIDLPGNETLNGRKIRFREQVKKFSTTQNASLIGGGALPGEENGKDIFEVLINGNRVQKVYNIYRIDGNYFDLLDIDVKTGRNFQDIRSGDKQDAVIINEALARSLGWKKPVGKTIWYERPRKIIGVIRDFHNRSLHHVIEPVVFIYNEDQSSKLLVRTATTNTAMLKALWDDFFPDTPFVLNYFDTLLAAGYQKEDRLAKLLNFFGAVSLALCCMGLFAVFSLDMFQRRKEMSIRKILGANAINLLKTATGRYLAITLLAVGAAIPFAWFLLAHWLSGFSYRIEMDPLIFILSAVIILSGSGITLAYHISKAIKVKPVSAIKQE